MVQLPALIQPSSWFVSTNFGSISVLQVTISAPSDRRTAAASPNDPSSLLDSMLLQSSLQSVAACRRACLRNKVSPSGVLLIVFDHLPDALDQEVTAIEFDGDGAYHVSVGTWRLRWTG
ncbi:uncharacterized protein LOC110868177 [Helianthus annuus]|uniref:uncharacterized protein LOC110868177 n=1 Tax=Helianthus annuus TaxID=4232 RepID=UPI000B8F93F8|nr:uncharacterized protein LOC110868177 [Helianthus annuus]